MFSISLLINVFMGGSAAIELIKLTLTTHLYDIRQIHSMYCNFELHLIQLSSTTTTPHSCIVTGKFDRIELLVLTELCLILILFSYICKVASYLGLICQHVVP